MKVIIDTFEMEKIKYWVTKCPKEIGGLGLATITPEGNIRVTDVFLLEQEVTGVETELSDDAITGLMTEVLGDPTLREKGSLQFWWHSHVNMGVFWSSTDSETIRKLSKHGWFATLVINKKFETRAAYSQGANNGYPYVMVDNLEVESTLLNSEVQSLLEAEYNLKVTEKKFYAPLAATNKHWYGTLSAKDRAWFDDDMDDDLMFGISQQYPKPIEAIKSDIPEIEDHRETENMDNYYFNKRAVDKKTRKVKKEIKPIRRR